MNHYQKDARAKEIPTCPICGKMAHETKTKYGLRAGCCGLWSWDRHPLVGESTHRARNAAHAAFDALWRGPSKILERGQAYAMLASEMGLRSEDCHMKTMDADTASKVPAAVQAIRGVKL